ncbi:MAG TPA: hypothetical protein VM782_06380 [Stellaceae bacterium]|nr:hypothetical protein [Stellaceae bacterium]
MLAIRRCARLASRHNCIASQKTLAAVMRRNSAHSVSSRLTLMLAATGLPKTSAAIAQIEFDTETGIHVES